MLSASFLLAWLGGVIWSDRFLPTQFLSWIPTFTVLPFVAVSAWTARTRPGTGAWILIGATLIGWIALVERPWRPGGEPTDGLRLLQWTMSHDKSDRIAHAEYIIGEDADITVLTHGYGVRGTEEIRAWLGKGHSPYKLGFFTILTRLPVRQLQSVGSSNDVHARFIEIDTTQQLGRPLRILAVDLPSTITRSRWEIAVQLKGWVEKRTTGPIDLVLGDFNMRRGSAAMRHAFPELLHAWDLAGRGWAATWSRGLPVYRIDHVLVASWLHVVDCTTSDPGIGRHRTQRVILSGSPEDP